MSDGIGTATGTLTLAVGAPKIWYVKNDAVAGDGRSSTPFNTLAAAVAASAANDWIYVFTGDGTTIGQNAGALLKNGQRLIGQGVALTVTGTFNAVVNPVLQASGSSPVDQQPRRHRGHARSR